MKLGSWEESGLGGASSARLRDGSVPRATDSPTCLCAIEMLAKYVFRPLQDLRAGGPGQNLDICVFTSIPRWWLRTSGSESTLGHKEEREIQAESVFRVPSLGVARGALGEGLQLAGRARR